MASFNVGRSHYGTRVNGRLYFNKEHVPSCSSTLTWYACSPSRSPRVHEAFVKHYGRNVRIRGFLPVSMDILFVFSQLTPYRSGTNVSSPSTLYLSRTYSSTRRSMRSHGSLAPSSPASSALACWRRRARCTSDSVELRHPRSRSRTCARWCP